MGRAALLIILAIIAFGVWLGKKTKGGLSGKKYDSTLSSEIDKTFEKAADRVHGLNAKWESAKQRAKEREEKQAAEKERNSEHKNEKDSQESVVKAAQSLPVISRRVEKQAVTERQPSMLARLIGERRQKKAIQIAREERRRSREARSKNRE